MNLADNSFEKTMFCLLRNSGKTNKSGNTVGQNFWMDLTQIMNPSSIATLALTTTVNLSGRLVPDPTINPHQRHSFIIVIDAWSSWTWQKQSAFVAAKKRLGSIRSGRYRLGTDNVPEMTRQNGGQSWSYPDWSNCIPKGLLIILTRDKPLQGPTFLATFSPRRAANSSDNPKNLCRVQPATGGSGRFR